MELQVETVTGKLAEHVLIRQNPAIFPELFVKYGDGKCFLPKEYKSHFETIDNFEVRNDDIWICSYIKAGTTWISEMVWLIVNYLDYDGAKQGLGARVPYLEYDAVYSNKVTRSTLKRTTNITSMDIVKSKETPRFIKTHLPHNLLPKEIRKGSKKPKIVYLTRNPKDVCVSHYHFRVLWEGYYGTIDEFVDEFINDMSMYAPFWTHVKEYWNLRKEPNILFLTYEELKADLLGVVRRVEDFLGKVSISVADADRLLDHLSFNKMKTNEALNRDEATNELANIHGVAKKTNFIRKGEVGSWKAELSEESIRKLDEWMTANKIPGLWEYLFADDL